MAPFPESRADFGRMVRQARQARALTLDALAAATGISKPYLSNIETARSPGVPTPEKLARLETALALASGTLARAADWLRTPASIRDLVSRGAALPRRPEGSIDLDVLLASSGPAAAPSTPSAAPPAELPLQLIPLINRVAAGPVTEFTDLDYPVGIADRYIPVPQTLTAPPAPGTDGVQALFALEITGDSMSPDYAVGDLVIVGSGTPRDGDDCLVRLGEQENFATTFKRIYFLPRGAPEPTHVRLVPVNPQHAERQVALDQITGLFPSRWKMTAIRRSV